MVTLDQRFFQLSHGGPVPSHLACPQSHFTHSICRVPRIGCHDVQWVLWNRDTLRRCKIHLRAGVGVGPAHGNAPRVCWVIIRPRQMGGHFSQEVNFCMAVYLFPFLGIAGFRLLMVAGNPFDVNGLGSHIATMWWRSMFAHSHVGATAAQAVTPLLLMNVLSPSCAKAVPTIAPCISAL